MLHHDCGEFGCRCSPDQPEGWSILYMAHMLGMALHIEIMACSHCSDVAQTLIFLSDMICGFPMWYETNVDCTVEAEQAVGEQKHGSDAQSVRRRNLQQT